MFGACVFVSFAYRTVVSSRTKNIERAVKRERERETCESEEERERERER